MRVRFGSARRVVCGVSELTTSRDVIFALAQASNKTGTFYLCDCDDGRVLEPDESVVCYCGRGEPTLFLRCADECAEELRFGSERGRRSCSAAQRRLTRFSSQRERRASLGSRSGVQCGSQDSRLSLARSQLTLQAQSDGNTPLSRSALQSTSSEPSQYSVNLLTAPETCNHNGHTAGLSLAMSAKCECSRLKIECAELRERLRIVDAQLSSTNNLLDSLKITLDQVALQNSNDQLATANAADRQSDERHARSRTCPLQLERFRIGDADSSLHF